MSRVLDLDLDYFVRPIAHFVSGSRRLDERHYSAADSSSVEAFLEQNCGLSKTSPIPGRYCVEHVGAYDTWRDWVRDGILDDPFEVVHVDAHADVGLGDSSWLYLLDEVLALPVSERGNPNRGPSGLNSGSYLAFAIANRWISELTYVYPAHARLVDGCPADIHTVFFRNEDWQRGPIELPHYSKEQLDELLMLTLNRPEPIWWEPPVRNSYINGEDLRAGEFTHMILAQSPGFTPKSADVLISAISQNFAPI